MTIEQSTWTASSGKGRPRRIFENDDYRKMVARMVRRYAARVADGDPEDLAGMLALERELSAAIRDAVQGQRERHSYSWTDIARGTGMTRQAAQKRWGR